MTGYRADEKGSKGINRDGVKKERGGGGRRKTDKEHVGGVRKWVPAIQTGYTEAPTKEKWREEEERRNNEGR